MADLERTIRGFGAGAPENGTPERLRPVWQRLQAEYRTKRASFDHHDSANAISPDLSAIDETVRDLDRWYAQSLSSTATIVEPNERAAHVHVLTDRASELVTKAVEQIRGRLTTSSIALARTWVALDGVAFASTLLAFATAMLLVLYQRGLDERQRLTGELGGALREVKQFERILPMCSYCKNIRDGDDRRQPLEDYINTHSAAQFSHACVPPASRRPCDRNWNVKVFDCVGRAGAVLV